jgi:hypothetical protein
VDVTQGSSPITSTTLASAPAVVRVAATTPKALDADAAPLELVGDGLTEASAPWASTDASVTWAQLVDPGTGEGTASGSLAGGPVFVSWAGAPLQDPFWSSDAVDGLDVDVAWSASGLADAAWAWTGQLYGVMSVLGDRDVTVIVPMDGRGTLDETGLEGELDAVTTITHPLPRLGLPSRPIDLGVTGVDLPRVTTVEIPAASDVPVQVDLWIEGAGVSLSTDHLDIDPITPGRVDLVLRPRVEGDVDAVLHVVSDDAWAPVLAVPLHGVAAGRGGDEAGCLGCASAPGGSPAALGLLLLARRRRR